MSIPENVFLLGTMNTADRSIARMDHALRRRFAFVRLDPRYDVLSERLVASGVSNERANALQGVLQALNQQIGDGNFAVGISYFMPLATSGESVGARLADVWQHEVEPYLAEYFHDDPEAAGKFAWAKLARKDGLLSAWAPAL